MASDKAAYGRNQIGRSEPPAAQIVPRRGPYAPAALYAIALAIAKLHAFAGVGKEASCWEPLSPVQSPFPFMPGQKNLPRPPKAGYRPFRRRTPPTPHRTTHRQVPHLSTPISQQPGERVYRSPRCRPASAACRSAYRVSMCGTGTPRRLAMATGRPRMASTSMGRPAS